MERYNNKSDSKLNYNSNNQMLFFLMDGLLNHSKVYVSIHFTECVYTYVCKDIYMKYKLYYIYNEVNNQSKTG